MVSPVVQELLDRLHYEIESLAIENAALKSGDAMAVEQVATNVHSQLEPWSSVRVANALSDYSKPDDCTIESIGTNHLIVPASLAEAEDTLGQELAHMEEIVSAATKCRGPANGIDLFTVLTSVKRMHARVDTMFKTLQRNIHDLEIKVGSPCARTSLQCSLLASASQQASSGNPTNVVQTEAAGISKAGPAVAHPQTGYDFDADDDFVRMVSEESSPTAPFRMKVVNHVGDDKPPPCGCDIYTDLDKPTSCASCDIYTGLDDATSCASAFQVGAASTRLARWGLSGGNFFGGRQLTRKYKTYMKPFSGESLE